MKQKSPVLAAVLGFFAIGLFYATGFTKKGVIAVIALLLVGWLIGMAVSTEVSVIANVAGAFLGYKWAKECNEGAAEAA